MPWRWDDPEVARGLPFLVFVLLLIAASLLPQYSTAIVVARGAVVALVLAWFWRRYIELRRPDPPLPVAWWLIAVAAGIAVFAAWIWLDQDWAVLSRAPGFRPLQPDGGIDWTIALLRLAGFALVVPVMEELFWRSLVLRWIERHDFLALEPRRVGPLAFAITTALFALEHDRWIAGLVAGVAYNLLYMRSGNLWVPIAAHATTNAALGIYVLHGLRWAFW
jgi:hypothetical protein